jgi:hypothetical protein
VLNSQLSAKLLCTWKEDVRVSVAILHPDIRRRLEGQRVLLERVVQVWQHGGEELTTQLAVTK